MAKLRRKRWTKIVLPVKDGTGVERKKTRGRCRGENDIQISLDNLSCGAVNNNNVLLLLLFDMDVSCHRPFVPGTSLEPTVIPTAQASSFTLQYFPYYDRCSKYSCV